MWLIGVFVRMCSTLLLMDKKLHTGLVILVAIFPLLSPTLTTIHTLAMPYALF